MVKYVTILFFSLSCSAFVMPQETGRLELTDINFSGNEEFSASVLSGVIASKESPGWFWKFLDSFTPLGSEAIYFDSSNIVIDLNSIKAFYNANGFFEAEVSYSLNYNFADKEVSITYIITENKPSRYKKEKLSGLDSVPLPVLRPLWDEIAVDTTKRYSQNELLDKITASLDILHNSGYLFAKFDSTVILRDTLYNRAECLVYFSTGKRYKIDTVIVSVSGDGSDEVSESLLRELTGIQKDEYYNLQKIRRSQLRLFRTGLFNSLNLSPVDRDTSSDRVPLKLEGIIGSMNELSPEVIVNNQQNAFNMGLGLSYVRKNFFGRARKLSFKNSFGIQDIFNADLTNLIRRFSFRDTTLLGYVDSRLSIEQPYLFDKPVFGLLEFYGTIDKQRNFNNTIYGTKFTTEFELPAYTFINLLNTSYNVEVSKEVYRTFNDSLSSKLISILGVRLGSLKTDNILFPTTGYNLSFEIEEANALPYLYEKITGDRFNGSLFYKILLNSSVYKSLDRGGASILAAKMKIGYIQTYLGDYAGIPLNRTFYAGGSNSVRGWRSNELVPKDSPVLVGIINSSVNVKGGTFLLESSFEYRQRFGESFGTAMFVDLGNTWIGYKDFQSDEIAVAAGFGFRYYTSIAPFRLDFGTKFYNPEDKRLLFSKNFWDNLEIHFGIGEAF